METFERTLRNLLLGPVGGARRTLGLRPDVQQGHRWCAVDGQGLPAGTGQLPHEATAGRAACLHRAARAAQDLRGRGRGGRQRRRPRRGAGARARGAGRAEGPRARSWSIVRRRRARARVAAEARVRRAARRALGVPRRATRSRGASRTRSRSWSRSIRARSALGPHLHDVPPGRAPRRCSTRSRRRAWRTRASTRTRRAWTCSRGCRASTARKAKAFDEARRAAGPLATKAALATIEGVGPRGGRAGGRLPAPPRRRRTCATARNSTPSSTPSSRRSPRRWAPRCRRSAPIRRSATRSGRRNSPRPSGRCRLILDVLWQLAEGTRDPRLPLRRADPAARGHDVRHAAPGPHARGPSSRASRRSACSSTWASRKRACCPSRTSATAPASNRRPSRRSAPWCRCACSR